MIYTVKIQVQPRMKYWCILLVKLSARHLMGQDWVAQDKIRGLNLTNDYQPGAKIIIIPENGRLSVKSHLIGPISFTQVRLTA